MFYRLYKTTHLPKHKGIGGRSYDENYYILEGGWYDNIEKCEQITYKGIFEVDACYYEEEMMYNVIKNLRQKRYIRADYLDRNFLKLDYDAREEYEKPIRELTAAGKVKLIKKGGYFTVTKPVF